jgi:NAD(P)-dependent dehydrogenase (short-subunit alcohol dehydrogenase family)
MRIIVFGAGGVIGSAVQKLLKEKGHEVVAVGRKSGEHHADLTDNASLKAFFSQIGPFEAVACAAGEVFASSFEGARDENWTRSVQSKGMGQINLVRYALPYISDKGSFTLVSGVLAEEFIAGGSIFAVVNSMVEGFTKAAAVELPRGVRINCISPTVLTEAVGHHPYFPGFATVDAAEVALAYYRAIANPFTGRVLKLHKTDS